jgi:hypothetical protein
MNQEPVSAQQERDERLYIVVARVTALRITYDALRRAFGYTANGTEDAMLLQRALRDVQSVTISTEKELNILLDDEDEETC